MILVIHIAIALASIGFSAWAFARPSSGKIKTSYGLIGGTIASGTLLVLTTHASLLRACVMGLAFVSVATGLTVLGQRKLASEESKE